MKKYYVARIYECATTTPSVVFMTDILEDARTYAGIMERSENKKFTVLTLVDNG